MQLSKRMEALAMLVTPGRFLADIGTDHGYLPVWLYEQGRITGAVAADVNAGPLRRAEQTIREHGLEGRILARLSDGLREVRAEETECVLIAGMGGMLMLRILNDGKEKLGSTRELILQPQSDIPLVRAWTLEHHWKIEEESVVEEEGKFYFCMRLTPAGDADLPPFTQIQERYGPVLLEKHPPELIRFLRQEREKLLEIRSRLADSPGEKAAARLSEIEQEIQWNASALEACMERKEI